VTGSEYTRGRFLAHFRDFPEQRVRVIHPGVWPGGSAEAEQDGYFLTVATVEPRKNHLGLLRALRAARASGFGLRWKVVGASGYSAEPIVAELRAEPGVEVLGWVPESDLQRLYRGARFAAYPSLAEGFGLPPLEAMARGLPVACSAGSAFDETVGDAALRIEPGDEGAWTEALLWLGSDAAGRDRLRARGLERAAQFDWRRTAAAYVAAYRDAF
jgi:glycosyltransferase involved in cell wall biosynthesis